MRGPLVLAFAPLFLACGGDDALELEPGCQPLLAGYHCTLPYPSDYYLVEDSSTPSGYRVELTGAASLMTNTGVSADVHTVFRADGFSHIPTTPDGSSASRD